MIVIACIVMMNVYITSLYNKIKIKCLQTSDARGKLINEVFNNVRFIKMTGLENYFLRKIIELRDEELKWTKKQYMRSVLTNTNNTLGPALFLIVLYAMKLYTDGVLALSQAFVSGMVFSVFQSSIRNVGFFIITILDCIISARRISFFLLSEEIDTKHITQNTNSKHIARSEYSIEISNGSFFWVNKSTKELYTNEKDRINKKIPDTNKNESEVFVKRKSKPLVNTTSNRDTNELESRLMDGNNSLSLEGSSSNEYENELILKSINHKIKKGSCVGIIGRVGCGKSTFLSSLMGETYYKEGSQIIMNGTVSYVSQKPWIMSSTVKDVILFGLDYNEGRLNECIRCAGMEEDLKSMQNGLDTMLGDRGVNLSGGQKMRIAIARSLYSNRDIYLFDDPISALDIHVGKVVMEEAILKYLKGKTRLVVTHALSYLPYFDYIIIMDNGRIVEFGAYEKISQTKIFETIKDTMKKEDPEEKEDIEEMNNDEPSSLVLQKSLSKGNRKMSLDVLLEKRLSSNSEEKKKELDIEENESLTKEGDDEVSQEKGEATISKKDAQDVIIDNIISSEDKSKGNVFTAKLIGAFFSYGGNKLMWIACISVMSIWAFTEFMNLWFLQYWTVEHPAQQDIKVFLSIMFSLTCINLVSRTMFNYSYLVSCNTISRKLSYLMTFRLMHASINNFFDRVPMGRILNRFIRDLNEVDWNLSYASGYFIQLLYVCITDFSASVYSSSYFMIIFIVVYMVASMRIQRRYMNLYREVVRLKSICSSPMIQAFSDCLNGATIIRTHDRQEFTLNSYYTYLDEFQKNCVIADGLSRWFILRLMILSILILVPGILLNLLVVKSGAGVFALLMRYLLVIISDINEMLDTLSNNENRMISFERCTYFTNIQPEKGYKNINRLERLMEHGIDNQLATTSSWPEKGAITIKNLKVKYRKNLPYVLKGISLSIDHGKKIGIVGRTGAGKTTLISALYRHFDDYEGDVTLDGIEMRDVDLKVLRSKITVIPQDPYIFNDTVRNNIDPLHQLTDNEIISILKDIQLWEKFKSDKGLEHMVEQGGSNLSQGEKQLLCLARALLYKNKLILMDEATANIDTQSENVIQRVLNERLNDCTILMIAHRLNTVLHCDKILVLDAGKIIEYGDIETLKKDKESHFYNMLTKFDELNENLS